MIRPLTLVCAAIAAISGLYLYHVKHQTQLLERRITRTNQAIDAARERTGVLRAEWTLMNDPERLAELAGQFLKLVTVAPRQFTNAADLGTRLPAVRALPVRPEISTDMPVADNAADGADPAVEAPLPLPPPAPPRAVVATAPAATPPRPATPPVPSGGATSGGAVVAGAPANAVRSPAPQPVVARPTAQPAPAPTFVQRTQPLQPTAGPPAVGPAVGGSGSALGMARGIMAPPVPVGGDIHLTRGN